MQFLGKQLNQKWEISQSELAFANFMTTQWNLLSNIAFAKLQRLQLYRILSMTDKKPNSVLMLDAKLLFLEKLWWMLRLWIHTFILFTIKMERIVCFMFDELQINGSSSFETKCKQSFRNTTWNRTCVLKFLIKRVHFIKISVEILRNLCVANSHRNRQ